MADPTKGEVAVNLSDGRTVTLCFDINAFIDMSDELGIDVPEIVKKLQDKDNPPSLKFQRVVMWGGLQKHQPDMSIRDAGEILVEASEAMAKSLGGAMRQDDGEAGNDADADPPKPRRGTATKSSKGGRG